jgi:acyl-CoA dehydrogenase
MSALTEEQRLFRDAVRTFCRQEIVPLVTRAEEAEEFPVALFPKLGAAGFLCPTFPEEHGGSGADTVCFCLLAEELGRVASGIAGSIVAHSSIGTSAIRDFGTVEQKRRYLPTAIRGEAVFAFALTEPNAGSDIRALETRAERRGDRYLLNGAKSFITNGGICTYALVAARTSGEGEKGISLFVVPREAKGFEVTGVVPKLGNRSSDCVGLAFHDCEVLSDCRVGGEGDGFSILMQSLNGGRMVVAARALGIAEAAFDASLRYAKDRKQFGKPIGQHEAIQFKLADMATQLRAARLLIYDAARAKDRGEDVAMLASMAKLFGTEAAQRVVDMALQIHGAYGYTREFPIERYYRDVRLTTIIEGTSEIQHLIIARRLLDQGPIR